MNRTDEYRTLMETLDHPPLKLDFTLDRALLRKKNRAQKRRRAIFAPALSLAGLLTVFVLLVNTLPGFAYAAGRIPLLRELAQFVALSPSLSAAVENEFVQQIGLEQTKDGITARIEYLIVDQKQLNVFYTLESEVYQAMDASPSITGEGGRMLESYSIYTDSGIGVKNGALRSIVINFMPGILPDFLNLSLDIHDNGSFFAEKNLPPEVSHEDTLFGVANDQRPETVASFSFPLSFDPSYTASAEILELNRTFTLDGQSITLVSAEIYPTQLRLTFDDEPENTAWLKSLKLYVENEKGRRFEGVTNGITSYGSIDSPMMPTYILESPFFSGSKELKLSITEAGWLDKDKERVCLDLKNTTAGWLPEGVTFSKAVKRDKGWILYFLEEWDNDNRGPGQVWNWFFYDAKGGEFVISSVSHSGAYGFEGAENFGEITFALNDYHEDEVWLEPISSHSSKLNPPVALKLK